MSYVRYPNSKQFLKELNSNKKLDKIYLFLGEESGEKDKFIKKISQMIFDDKEIRRNSTGNFHLENDEILQAVDFALSQSMFSSDKVCIMRNIDEAKSDKKTKLFFSDLLSNLPETTTLIMTSSANYSPKILTEDFLKKIKIIQFWRYFDRDIYNYIKLNTGKMNLDIDDRAIALLLQLTGKDIKKIDDALEILKISDITGRVTEESIKNLVNDVSDVSIFDFLDSLFKKMKNSLKLLKKLLDNGNSELLILNMILKQVETLEKCHHLLEKGNTYDEAFKKCRVNDRNKEKVQIYLSKYSPEKVREIFQLVSSTDYKIKSSGASKSLVSNPLFEMVSAILIM